MFCWRGDLFVPAAELWLDPHEPRPFAFVSHAHGDHIGRHDHVLATPATARLMEHRLGPLRVTRLPFGQPLEPRPGVRVRLEPAGHILGSAQLVLEHEGRRLVYSGDFRLEPALTAEPAAVVPCDVLVMECTYGRPHYRFPPRAEVVPALAEDLRRCLADGRTPILLAYTLGRSQEVLKLLEPYDFRFLVAPQIGAMLAVFEELGVRFPAWEVARPGATDGAVVLVPPHGQRSRIVRQARRPVRIAVTGWAMDGPHGPPYPTDRSYPLSDHADFAELERYVTLARPREVYTLHGFDEFHRHLRARGISAHPVESRAW